MAYTEGEKCAQAQAYGNEDLNLDVALVDVLELVIPGSILQSMQRHHRDRRR